MKKYKVIKTFTSTEGTLYVDEIVKRDGNQTLKDHIRIRDGMGKIWFIPESYLKIAWTFLKNSIYILLKLLMSLKRGR